MTTAHWRKAQHDAEDHPSKQSGETYSGGNLSESADSKAACDHPAEYEKLDDAAAARRTCLKCGRVEAYCDWCGNCGLMPDLKTPCDKCHGYANARTSVPPK